MTTPPDHISPATRRSILLLSFATFSSMVAQRVCDAMLPELSREFAINLTQAAQVVSVFAVAYGLSQLVYGPLGDRTGKFRTVAAATLFCSVGSVWAALAEGFHALVIARVLVALGAAAIIPLSMAWVGDHVAYAQRQSTLARVGLGTTLGLGAGQLLGGMMTDAFGWRWAFALTAVLFATVGALLWADWRKQLALHADAMPDEAVVRPGFVAQALLILTGKWSRIVLLVALIEGAAGFGVMAIWATHLHQELHLSLSAAGTIVAVFGVGGMAYMALARHFIARLGESGLARIGASVVGVAALVQGYATHWSLALAASVVGGFGFFMFHNTMQANATQMAPAARGTAVSLFALILFLGQSLGVLLAATMVERWGSSQVVALGGGVVMAVGVFFAEALRRRDALMHVE